MRWRQLIVLLGMSGIIPISARGQQQSRKLPQLGLLANLTDSPPTEAFRAGLLPFEETELLLLEIAARPDIWISEKLCRQIVEQLRQGR